MKHNGRLVNSANPLPIISIMNANQKKIVLRFRDNSKHFYQRLKDDGHPYVVRWWDTLVGLGLCDDVINIIAGYCFHKSTFPKVELMREMVGIGVFGHYKRPFQSKPNEGAFVGVNVEVALHYFDVGKASIPYLDKLFGDSDDATKWLYCCNTLSKVGYHFDTKNEYELKMLKPYVISCFTQKILSLKSQKIQRLWAVLRKGIEGYEERHFKKDIFRARWRHPDGRYKHKEGEATALTDFWGTSRNDACRIKIYADIKSKDCKWVKPCYLDDVSGVRKLSKKQVLERLFIECKNGNIKEMPPYKLGFRIDEDGNSHNTFKSHKHIDFLLWYYMTEGTKTFDLAMLKHHIKKKTTTRDKLIKERLLLSCGALD